MPSLMPLNLTRNQLAQICNNNPQAIKALEQLFYAVNTTIPSSSSSLVTRVKSNEVLLWLST